MNTPRRLPGVRLHELHLGFAAELRMYKHAAWGGEARAYMVAPRTVQLRPLVFGHGELAVTFDVPSQ